MDNSGGFNPPPPPPPPGGGMGGAGMGGGGALPPRGLGDILSAAFEIYKNNAAKLITIVAVVVIPLQLVAALLANVVFAAKTRTISNGPTTITTTLPRSAAAIALLALLAAIIFVVIWAALQAAITRAAARTTIGDDVDVADSYRWGFSRLGSVIWVAILIGVVAVVGALLCVLLIAAVPPLGVLALIAWALFVWTALSVSVPSLVVENRRGTAALSRSWNLVKSYFWHVFGTILVTAIITGIISSVISALGGRHWFTSWIFGSIGQVLTAPFTAMVAVLLYLDLRTRSEALTANTLRMELASNP